MVIERKPCTICGKIDCKRYGNVLISGTFNTKTGKHEDCKTGDCTITECELKQIGEDVYIV